MVKKIIIVAAGTGGHIFPALSVAIRLRELKVDVLWVGSSGNLEKSVVQSNNFPLFTLQVTGFRRKIFIKRIFSIFQSISGIFRAFKILRSYKPDVVLAMGGFICWPVGIASWLARKPLILHEQNAIPGLTNKLLSYFANRILTGFPDSFSNIFKKNKVHYVGNPVRPEIINLPSPDERLKKHDGPINLLVFGGSQGASIFNKVVPNALAKFTNNKLNVWHQTGSKQYKDVCDLYNDYNINAKVSPFINDMSEAYQWADLVICRAGASTLAELMAVGLAAILIPYPYAVDDHQTANAKFLVKKSAAILMQQGEFNKERLYDVLKSLDRCQLIKMANTSRELRNEKAVDLIIEELINVN